jgi:ribosomal protein S18 acetylase RimI-like enzyme
MAAFSIRPGGPNDVDGIRALLPRLADFEIPARRNPEHLWRGDEKTLLAWSQGDRPDCLVFVAVDPGNAVLGVAMTTLRQELLSGAPSAHLEVLAVAVSAQGQGIGRSLMNEVEGAVSQAGATTMTLHVFAANERARQMYEGAGYDGELIRFIKDLG